MDKVFKALADPSRRLLLDRLFEASGQTLGELCKDLDMSRQAVTQHLGVLEAADLVVLPTPFAPDTLKGFLDGLNQVSVHSIHHHFIEARLRLHRMSNDFSNWLEQQVGLTEAADAIERIDIYTNTTEGVRLQIARIVAQAMNQERAG